MFAPKGDSMNGTIIALRGVVNSGKTTTISKVYEQLKKEPGVKVIKPKPPRMSKEVRSILEVDGSKVGFVSKSEPEEKYEDWIREVIVHGCIVIVVATHSTETCRAWEFVQPLAGKHGYDLRPIKKERGKSDQEIEHINRKQAREILSEITKGINLAQRRGA